jgi:outer membrane protein assembly factor BamD (BamD/ComL family)
VNTTYHIIRGTVLLILVIGLGGWALFHVLKRSEDPARLVFKWILTAVVIGLMMWKVAPLVGGGGYDGAFIGIPLTAVCGLALAIIWRHNIASIVAKPFASLYDGGDAEIDPQPYYSIPIAKRKKGKYTEAVAEIRKQLEKFPNDIEGQMMLAEIQVENLNDLPGAELTIQRLCAQPGHAPGQIALALNALADWHLKFAQDREAARQDLQQIVDLFPDTELALVAAQRIAHLANTDLLLSPHDRQRIHVPEGVQNLGLLQSSSHLRPAGTDPAKLAADYVKHLEEHPQDTEAREKLAVIYADHYARLDLAADQLDQLINQPNQPGKLVVHWLNLLADLQLRNGAGYDTVSQTLEQIIERYPNLAAAGMARNRIDLLKLELKAKQTNQPIKLGKYEQNIGLKQGVPRGT